MNSLKKNIFTLALVFTAAACTQNGGSSSDAKSQLAEMKSSCESANAIFSEERLSCSCENGQYLGGRQATCVSNTDVTGECSDVGNVTNCVVTAKNPTNKVIYHTIIETEKGSSLSAKIAKSDFSGLNLSLLPDNHSKKQKFVQYKTEEVSIEDLVGRNSAVLKTLDEGYKKDPNQVISEFSPYTLNFSGKDLLGELRGTETTSVPLMTPSAVSKFDNTLRDLFLTIESLNGRLADSTTAHFSVQSAKGGCVEECILTQNAEDKFAGQDARAYVHVKAGQAVMKEIVAWDNKGMYVVATLGRSDALSHIVVVDGERTLKVFNNSLNLIGTHENYPIKITGGQK